MNIDKAIAAIWTRSTEVVCARVEQLESAVAALLYGTLTDPDRREAARAARSLAGSVGSFGFAHASTLAREAQLLLEGDAIVPPQAILRLSTIAVDLRHELVGRTMPPESMAGAKLPRSVVAIADDVMIREILAAALGARGVTVHGVEDASLALETIDQVRPNLIVLDVDTPGLDGLMLCRQLRAAERTAKTPILFVALDADPRSVQAMLSAGADAHVAKPVNLDDLAVRIVEIVARRRRARIRSVSAPQPGQVAQLALDRFSTDVAIVDDDAVLTTLLCQAIESRGHSCATIPDGTEAITTLCGANPRVRPAVILLEVSLPGIDGLAVLRALARHGVTKRARVIMLTARSLDSEMMEALALGAHDHVAKPFSVPLLMQRLHFVLNAAAAA